MFAGPAAVGYAIGSCIGFLASTWFYWSTTVSAALSAFDTYPELMMLHLIRNYRTNGFERINVNSKDERRMFRGRLDRELNLRCLLIAAYHTAMPAIDVSGSHFS